MTWFALDSSMIPSVSPPRKEVAPREGDRREVRRHEKRHERGGGRHDRQMMDARSKIEKRKMMEREMVSERKGRKGRDEKGKW